MERIPNQTAQNYFRRVKRELPLPSKDCSDFLNGLKNNLLTYLDSQPNPTKDDLINKFGEPKAVAEYYIEDMGLINTVHSKRRFRRIIFVTALTLILILSVLFGFIISDLLRTEEVHVTEKITIYQTES